MEKRMSSFESHLNIIESGHNKTASARMGSSNSLLAKLAEELGVMDDEAAAAGVAPAGAPIVEGQVYNGDSGVEGVNPAIQSATEGVYAPQLEMAGGDLEGMEAGELPAAILPNQGVVFSAGDGDVSDANSMHRTDLAVAEAADVPLTDEEVKVAYEADKIGRMIAESFQDHIEKTALDRQYAESLQYLNDEGLLEGYSVNDVSGLDKTASLAGLDGSLEKLANNNPMSKREVIAAAIEYSEIQKVAAEQEYEGRTDAREYAAEIEKQARYDARLALNEYNSLVAQAEEESIENEKVASLMSDPQVVAAVNILKSRGVM